MGVRLNPHEVRLKGTLETNIGEGVPHPSQMGADRGWPDWGPDGGGQRVEPYGSRA